MRLRSSMAHLEMAVSLAEDIGESLLAGHCRITLAGTLIYAGRTRESLALIRRVVDELPYPDRRQAEAQLIPILIHSGLHREALVQSEGLLNSLQDDELAVWGARVWQARSMAHLYLGAVEPGTREATRAIEIYQSLGNETGVARTRHNVAALRGLAGDAVAALQLFDQVEDEFRRLDIPISLGADGRIGTYFAAGLTSDAVDEAASAMRAAKVQGAEGLLAESSMWHALALAQVARWSEAAESSARARAAFAEQGRSAWEAFASALEVEAQIAGLAGAVRCCSPGPEFKTASQWRDQATAAATAMRASGWAHAKRSELIAALLTAATDPDVGAELLTELSGLREAELIEHRLLGWLAAGAAALVGPQRSDPGTIVDAARIWREGAELGRDDSPLLATLDGSLVVHSVRSTLTLLAVSLLLRAGHAHEAFEAVEDERAMSSLVRLRPGDDVAEEQLLSELRAIRLQAASPNSEEHVRDLLRRQGEIERSLRDRAVRHLDSKPAAPSANRTGPDSDAIDVCFLIDEGRVIALVSEQDRPVACHNLAFLKDLARVTRAARGSIERLALGPHQWDVVGPALAHDMAKLDDLLIRPWLPTTPLNSVRLSVPGDLDVAWCTIPSLTMLTVTLGPLRAPTTVNARRRPSDITAIAGPNLTNAANEVQRIKEVRDAVSVTGPAASRNRVKAELARAHTVHLACHGSLRHDQPLFSSLELADGPLFLHDLARVGGVPDVVILSACNAGRSSASKGGTAGFARTLRSLGSKTVIAPFATVNDQLVMASMVELHRRLADGDEPAVALARARTAKHLRPAERFTGALFGAFT